MSSQLKKLGNLGVDPSSARANESFCLIGTPLPPLEKSKDTGEFVPLWKQDVRDEQGRKRLHRAFTGGFSAGYFNTVKASEAVGMVLPLARSLLLVLASLSTTPTTMMSTAASRRTETVLRATLLIEKKTKRYLLEARQIPGVDLVLFKMPATSTQTFHDGKLASFVLSDKPVAEDRWFPLADIPKGWKPDPKRSPSRRSVAPLLSSPPPTPTTLGTPLPPSCCLTYVPYSYPPTPSFAL
ncbi:hypothetical protein DFH08DRAFT_975170 [Mycena albidolilacea]|uniref:G patch domain-containing protein n=1 Tax=Mycena albidolilacea TaxID=1033008 RepID=A0AAD7EBM0_9AGAR|nr:hypothetical protein DFH08DRAFT_975170 [Mycena albidolilacea]